MNKRSIKIALVDDHAMFRKTLQTYLSGEEGLQVYLETSDCTSLCEADLRPIDIMILDAFMPKLSAVEAIHFLRDRNPYMRILVLSMCTDLGMISELVRLGIYGYIHKTEEPGELVRAIYSAYEDSIYKNKLFTDALYLYEKRTIHSYSRAKYNFNEREKKILNLVWEEKSNKEIASEIYLSVRSVEKIRQDMKDRLEVSTTIGLLKYALENGIIYSKSKV